MYRIRLQQFEGPLDLLLFFIRRDELDIYDIPIAGITGEFLNYVRYLEEIDLDGVGDFLYMAAVLINIKTRMLLPSQEKDEKGEPLDPRRELVERLLEYIQFKEASEELVVKMDRRSEQYTRGRASGADAFGKPLADELIDATVFDLVTALRRVLTQAPEEALHEVMTEEYSVEDQQDYLRETLRVGDKSSFFTLASGKSRTFIIVTFLAVLELARMGEINIFLGSAPDDFFIEIKKKNPGDYTLPRA